MKFRIGGTSAQTMLLRIINESGEYWNDSTEAWQAGANNITMSYDSVRMVHKYTSTHEDLISVAFEAVAYESGTTYPLVTWTYPSAEGTRQVTVEAV